MILLTDEERADAIFQATGVTSYSRHPYLEEALVKTQLKKVVEWGDTICVEHGMRKRRKCDKCWQAVLKEIE